MRKTPILCMMLTCTIMLTLAEKALAQSTWQKQKAALMTPWGE